MSDGKMFGVVSGVLNTSIAEPPPPRWVPGFILDLVCLVRGHKPHALAPFVCEFQGQGIRWEFCVRCGRLFGARHS